MQPGSLFVQHSTSESRFHLIRRSNECPNTKIILETLTSAIGGTEFPQLISCHSCSNHRSLLSDIPIPIQTGPRIFEPFTTNTPLQRSLASEKYNEKTIELLDSEL